jgi:hypothetical protein
MMTKYHHIQEIVFNDNKMHLKVDGTEYIFQLEKISKKLAKASKSELERFEISASGYGTGRYWMKICLLTDCWELNIRL